MRKNSRSQQPFAEQGKRLKELRESKGFSRSDLAGLLGINLTSLAGWESGKRLPRAKLRLALARALGSDPSHLFAIDPECPTTSIAVSAFDTIDELEGILLDLTTRTNRRLRALRLAAPYETSAHIQTGWRNLVSKRILDGSLEVSRIEIFYNLRRLQEAVSNIFLYAGRRYYIKSYCAGVSEVVPAIGGYFFDSGDIVLGGYWANLPPHDQPSLRMSGAPFRIFYDAYWEEIWRRGTLLNVRGPYDLSAVYELAVKLGLKHENWDRFVTEAKSLQIGDGAPPLI